MSRPPGFKLTEEHKRKLSEAAKGKAKRPAGFKHSEDTKRKMAEAATGRKHTKESKRKMAAAKRENPVRYWASQPGGAMSGKKHSAETRKKMRKAQADRVRRVVNWVEYGGQNFRSTWEVRFAQALDARGIGWIYEPKRFDLGDITYLPDFYLPETGAYWEVKGWIDQHSAKQIRLFRERFPETPLIVVTQTVLEQMEV